MIPCCCDAKAIQIEEKKLPIVQTEQDGLGQAMDKSGVIGAERV
ncbi:MAG TPA: hypothetical protein VJJ55_02535 [Candidatus Paceibacterota bacterium]